MDDADYDAPARSRDDVLAALRAHHDRLREEADATTDKATRSSLSTTLDDVLTPLIEQMEKATEHAELLRAAHTYLGACYLVVVPRLSVRRRSQMQERSDQAMEVVRAYELGRATARPVLADTVRELGRCVDDQAGAIVKQLQAINGSLQSISKAFEQINPPDGSSRSIGGTLSHLDYILTGSMKLLVGDVPEPAISLPPTPASSARTEDGRADTPPESAIAGGAR